MLSIQCFNKTEKYFMCVHIFEFKLQFHNNMKSMILLPFFALSAEIFHKFLIQFYFCSSEKNSCCVLNLVKMGKHHTGSFFMTIWSTSFILHERFITAPIYCSFNTTKKKNKLNKYYALFISLSFDSKFSTHRSKDILMKCFPKPSLSYLSEHSSKNWQHKSFSFVRHLRISRYTGILTSIIINNNC